VGRVELCSFCGGGSSHWRKRGRGEVWRRIVVYLARCEERAGGCIPKVCRGDALFGSWGTRTRASLYRGGSNTRRIDWSGPLRRPPMSCEIKVCTCAS